MLVVRIHCFLLLAGLLVGPDPVVRAQGFGRQQELDAEERSLVEESLSGLNADAMQRVNAIFVREYLHRVDTLGKELQQLATESERVQRGTERLLIDDRGKRLATRADAVRAFIGFEQSPVVKPEEVDLHLARMEPLRQGIFQYTKVPKLFDPSKVPEIKQLADEEAWATTHARELISRKQQITALLRLVPKNLPVDGLPSLQDQVETVVSRMIQEEMQAIDSAREEGRIEAVAGKAEAAKIRELEIGKKEVENELKLARLELAKLQAEYELLEAKKQAEIQDTKQQVRDKELQTKLEDKVILRKLRPFTANGYWQPGDSTRAQSLEKKPMSLSRLEQFGALGPGHNGLARLLAVANGAGMGPTDGRQTHPEVRSVPRTYTGTYRARKHIDTDRPKWGYPKFYPGLSAEDLLEVREVQDLLVELGPTMVEQGLLAP